MIEGLEEFEKNNSKPNLGNKQNKKKQEDTDENLQDVLLSEATYHQEYNNYSRRIARANTLRTLRVKRSWTQKKMAEALGTSLRTYQRFESAEKDVPMNVMDRWLNNLGEGILTISV